MIKSPEKKIRVLVVDDSAFMCKVLQEIINADPQLEVAGQARDGRDAVALAARRDHHGHQYAARGWLASHRNDHVAASQTDRHREF